MTDHRPAASLTSSLLARRGDARPAMRRQPLANLGAPLAPHEDLGWNDIGQDEVPAPPPVTSLAAMSSPDLVAKPQETEPEPVAAPVAAPVAPVQSPVNRQLEAIARRIHEQRAEQSFKPMLARDEVRAAAPSPKRERQAVPAAISERKAAFTLRLEPERHLRLRLLSAVSRRSAQTLLIEALDALLAQHDKVEDLAGQVETGADIGSADHIYKKQA